MKRPHRAMALRGLHYCAAILIKKVLVDSIAEIPCNGAEIVVCDGLEDFPGGMNKVPYLSSLFNGVISCHSAGSWKNGLKSATSSGFMRYVRLPPLRSCQPCSQTSPKGAVFSYSCITISPVISPDSCISRISSCGMSSALRSAFCTLRTPVTHAEIRFVLLNILQRQCSDCHVPPRSRARFRPARKA